MLTPKLSIITVNLNNTAGLQKTMESVFTQSFTEYEYIIIDGGSTDGSKELIENNANKFVYWVSEKDEGIYNAMNKGIQEARGEYIQFLNSGDYLVNKETLLYIGKKITQNPSVDFFYSDVINSENQSIHKYPTKLTFKYFFEFTINHQSTIFKRNLFKKYGNFNEYFKIVSDWEFFMKILFLHGCIYLHLELPILIFDYKNGISTATGSQKLILEEREKVLKELFPHILPDYIFFESVQKSNTWKMLQRINKIKKVIKK